MYAVIETGGKQYRVAPGDEITLEKLDGNAGDAVTFDKVLFTSDGEKVLCGRPYIEESKVVGRILRQGLGRKVLVIKYKRRKGYRRKRGHRQHHTLVKIDQIEA